MSSLPINPLTDSIGKRRMFPGAGASFNRGESKQDWGTPPEFLDAVRKRLNTTTFLWDLAASELNKVETGCGWFSEGDNALNQSWQLQDFDTANQWLWCNPPYTNISPWVQKASEESAKGAHIAMLLPASVGANWWLDYVHDKAHVLFLNGRITFVGATTPYPKDCALLLYTPMINGGYEIWSWK